MSKEKPNTLHTKRQKNFMLPNIYICTCKLCSNTVYTKISDFTLPIHTTDQ